MAGGAWAGRTEGRERKRVGRKEGRRRAGAPGGGNSSSKSAHSLRPPATTRSQAPACLCRPVGGAAPFKAASEAGREARARPPSCLPACLPSLGRPCLAAPKLGPRVASRAPQAKLAPLPPPCSSPSPTCPATASRPREQSPGEEASPARRERGSRASGRGLQESYQCAGLAAWREVVLERRGGSARVLLPARARLLRCFARLAKSSQQQQHPESKAACRRNLQPAGGERRRSAGGGSPEALERVERGGRRGGGDSSAGGSSGRGSGRGQRKEAGRRSWPPAQRWKRWAAVLVCQHRDQDSSPAGVKEELPEKPKCASTADKVGWIKKNSGGILGLWKERYILLCKSQLLMYEDEDEQKCVETVELENYEKCQDLRALLNRKHRFILIRSPGYKVQDIKFQAGRKEEKELWMKALNEGINRGKNRIFDEVKVDKSLCLEHVTRGRAKMGQGRRPPTRSHLKEVANTVSDGILRLDLDVPDSGPPNATLVTSDTANVAPKEPVKPPMPPAKPPTEKLNPEPTSKDLEAKNPPMPPAKNIKETEAPIDSLSVAEGDGGVPVENAEETKVGPQVERLVEAGEETPQAPVPPPKILSDKMKVSWDDPATELPVVNNGNLPAAGSKENLREDAKEAGRPPTPPPKILSKKLRASMNSKRGSSEVDTSEDDQRPDEWNSPVNGTNGEGVTGSPPEQRDFEPPEEELFFQEQRENSSAREAKKESSSLPAKDQALLLEPVGNSPPPKTRSSSVGDLLTEPREKPRLGQGFRQGAALPLCQMERKVAYEREITERLLQQVLSEQPPAGNGPPTDREALLSEAVERLRQATQVLQESKGSEELQREPGEKVKGVPKDLATLYRRSAP
ncbi:pleckstrin homology domain-containing family O member 2 [Heteronotia binoei]|uniref:pleckstrin homology domain-containing family O member 2 n=1 Tax=Heteronotia binoei TaxID=13085 RepID=UPI00292E48DB|nr:pleckstrin homology domain-containing family O member 2 [Heteronotia binoei]